MGLIMLVGTVMQLWMCNKCRGTVNGRKIWKAFYFQMLHKAIYSYYTEWTKNWGEKMRTILHGLLNLNKEDLRICLTAENEGCYTVQDMHLAVLIFHTFFLKLSSTLISMEVLFKNQCYTWPR